MVVKTLTCWMQSTLAENEKGKRYAMIGIPVNPNLQDAQYQNTNLPLANPFFQRE